MGITRRELFKGLAGLLLGGFALSKSKAQPPARRRVLRIAHLTDIHLEPNHPSVSGFIRCLRTVHELNPRPDLILNGGDSVADVFAQNADRAKALAETWRKVLKENCTIPVEHCIGNHDVWGWNKEKSGCTGNEPNYGKKWAMELFELETPYRSFDRAGWHFIVLDGTFPAGNGYTARLDEEQFEWLKEDLKRTPASTPILVLGHQPILSVSAYLDGDNEKTGNWVVPGAWMHIDARRIVELFYQHKNVKLCLSGHIHLYDKSEYNGVTYVCNGAVSGGWWGGNYHQTPPGFGLIDLYDDGSFETQYLTY